VQTIRRAIPSGIAVAHDPHMTNLGVANVRQYKRRRLTRLLRAVLVTIFVGGFLSVASSAESGILDPAGSGYWMVSDDGYVHPFGSAPLCPNAFGDAHDPVSLDDGEVVDIVAAPDGLGYWTLTNYYKYPPLVQFHHCGVYGPYPFLADYWWQFEGNNVVTTIAPDEGAWSMAATPDGTGYWVFTDRGRAIPFGSAQWYGDMGNTHLNGPVIDAVVTPSGRGYWMVAYDGGIFAFGDAQFYGSMGGQRLNAPVISMAPDPDGTGYWLVANDGGIFAFGAPFYGSTGHLRLNAPISGIVQSPTGGGYLMVAYDGGIFAFGDVPFHGSLGANPPASDIVAVTVMP
jgi:hypothetical protein